MFWDDRTRTIYDNLYFEWPFIQIIYERLRTQFLCKRKQAARCKDGFLFIAECLMFMNRAKIISRL